MRQLVLEGPGQLRLVDSQLPVPSAGEVRVLVHVAGICGSDLHGYRNDNRRRAAGTVMGHELSGRIDAPGAGVEGWSQGDEVVVNPLLGCGSCQACLDGQPNRCPLKTIIGCTPRWPGGFSEALVVPASTLVRWAGPAPLAWGALVEPLAVGFQAVRAADVTGQRVLVIGSGGVGIGVAVAARRQGARSITVMDRDSRRREQMAHLDLTMTTMTTVRDVTGTGAYDTVIDCVADSETLGIALGASRPGSVVVVVGLGRETAELALTPLVQGERTLRGSAQYTPAIFREVAEWVMTRPVDLSPLLSTPVKIADAPALFAGWDDDPDRFVRVLLEP